MLKISLLLSLKQLSEKEDDPLLNPCRGSADLYSASAGFHPALFMFIPFGDSSYIPLRFLKSSVTPYSLIRSKLRKPKRRYLRK
jgi:hypothetical protein